MVLPQVVGVPLLFDLLVIHGGGGVAPLVAYSADLVRSFPNRVYLLRSLPLRSDESLPQN